MKDMGRRLNRIYDNMQQLILNITMAEDDPLPGNMITLSIHLENILRILGIPAPLQAKALRMAKDIQISVKHSTNPKVVLDLLDTFGVAMVSDLKGYNRRKFLTATAGLIEDVS